MAQELDTFMNKVVSVITGDGRNFVGLMKGYDQTINIILENSHERVFRGEQLGVEQIELGLYVVRGDNVAVIGELDEDLDRRIDFEQMKVNPLQPFWI
ncbi:UNVERIFIED_CONTAM: Sm-like protein LSM8, partial [Eudyptes robustus]